MLWTPLWGIGIAGTPKGVQHLRQPQSNDLLQDLLSQVRNAIKNKGVCYPLKISYPGLTRLLGRRSGLLSPQD
jgi:hypothetical protein